MGQEKKSGYVLLGQRLWGGAGYDTYWYRWSIIFLHKKKIPSFVEKYEEVALYRENTNTGYHIHYCR